MGFIAATTIITTFAIDANASNRQWWDTTYKYDKAYITLADDNTICGDVESWTDYENSDTVQVRVNGKTYLTHYSNVVLVDE